MNNFLDHLKTTLVFIYIYVQTIILCFHFYAKGHIVFALLVLFMAHSISIHHLLRAYYFIYFYFFISACTSGKVVVRCRRMILISFWSSSFMPCTARPALLNSVCKSSPPCSFSSPRPTLNRRSCSMVCSSSIGSLGVMLASGKHRRYTRKKCLMHTSNKKDENCVHL